MVKGHRLLPHDARMEPVIDNLLDLLYDHMNWFIQYQKDNRITDTAYTVVKAKEMLETISYCKECSSYFYVGNYVSVYQNVQLLGRALELASTLEKQWYIYIHTIIDFNHDSSNFYKPFEELENLLQTLSHRII